MSHAATINFKKVIAAFLILVMSLFQIPALQAAGDDKGVDVNSIVDPVAVRPALTAFRPDPAKDLVPVDPHAVQMGESVTISSGENASILPRILPAPSQRTIAKAMIGALTKLKETFLKLVNENLALNTEITKLSADKDSNAQYLKQLQVETEKIRIEIVRVENSIAILTGNDEALEMHKISAQKKAVLSSSAAFHGPDVIKEIDNTIAALEDAIENGKTKKLTEVLKKAQEVGIYVNSAIKWQESRKAGSQATVDALKNAIKVIHEQISTEKSKYSELSKVLKEKRSELEAIRAERQKLIDYMNAVTESTTKYVDLVLADFEKLTEIDVVSEAALEKGLADWRINPISAERLRKLRTYTEIMTNPETAQIPNWFGDFVEAEKLPMLKYMLVRGLVPYSNMSLNELKNWVEDLKGEYGDDPNSHLEKAYHGVKESLDMVIAAIGKINNLLAVVTVPKENIVPKGAAASEAEDGAEDGETIGRGAEIQCEGTVCTDFDTVTGRPLSSVDSSTGEQTTYTYDDVAKKYTILVDNPTTPINDRVVQVFDYGVNATPLNNDDYIISFEFIDNNPTQSNGDPNPDFGNTFIQYFLPNGRISHITNVTKNETTTYTYLDSEHKYKITLPDETTIQTLLYGGDDAPGTNDDIFFSVQFVDDTVGSDTFGDTMIQYIGPNDRIIRVDNVTEGTHEIYTYDDVNKKVTISSHPEGVIITYGYGVDNKPLTSDDRILGVSDYYSTVTYQYNDTIKEYMITEVVHFVKGDYNGDKKVDAADYVMWRNLNGTNNPAADGDKDGDVDDNDRLVWRAGFGACAEDVTVITYVYGADNKPGTPDDGFPKRVQVTPNRCG